MAEETVIVNPARARAETHRHRAAPRAPELAGHKVVLFSNNKPNVDPFHDELAAFFRTLPGVADVAVLRKRSAALPADEAVVEQVRDFAFAVNAIAD
ncbi:MAG: hypothetical protein K6V97_02340 [Actinomycetia bacterium]|jgi:hypothetical protein|nr:hypothetical protein [Actinomycetes bacterium]